MVSTLSLCTLILVLTWLAVGWLCPTSPPQALGIGVLWLGLTLPFELLAGHLDSAIKYPRGARACGIGPGRYFNSALSLAVLELLVLTDPDLLPNDLQACEIEIPGDLSASVLDLRILPPDWREIPDHPACRAAGDEWLE